MMIHSSSLDYTDLTPVLVGNKVWTISYLYGVDEYVLKNGDDIIFSDDRGYYDIDE